jgi:hypothetical protein
MEIFQEFEVLLKSDKWKALYWRHIYVDGNVLLNFFPTLMVKIKRLQSK